MSYDDPLQIRDKVGEIYRLSSEHISFVCSRCDEEFNRLELFVDHVQTHLHDIVAVFMGPDGVTKDEEMEMKPFIHSDSIVVESAECHFTELIDVKTEPLNDNADDAGGDIRVVNNSKQITKGNKKERDLEHCPRCDYTCAQPSGLLKHMVVHSDRRGFKCDKCPKTYKTKKHMDKHKECHSKPDGRNAMPDVPLPQSRSTETPPGVADDLTSFIETMLRCTQCDFKTTNSNRLAKHMSIHYERRDFQCDICPKAFKKKTYLTYHKKFHTGRRDFKCDICAKAFITESCLQRHKSTHPYVLIDSSTADDTNRTYECFLCKNPCISQVDCMQHISDTHTKSPWLKCIHCGYRCIFKVHLVKHALACCGEDCVCNFCGQMFVSKVALQEHIEMQEKRFQCDECGKRFVKLWALELHQISHSNEKKFKCDKCPITFKHKRTLSEHRRTHEGHTNECDICGKQFTLLETFKKHKQRVHSNQRNYACDMCPKMFKSSSNLTSHRRIHLNDFNFTCQWCKQGFHDNRIYKRHTLAVHGRAWDEKPLAGS